MGDKDGGPKANRLPPAARKQISIINWQEKTKDNPRTRSLRTSIFSTKSRAAQGLGNIFKDVRLPEMEPAEKLHREQMTKAERRQQNVEIANAWIGENLVDFFQEISMIHSTVVYNNHTWDKAMKNPELLPNRGFPVGANFSWDGLLDLEDDLPGQKKLEAKDMNAARFMDRLVEWFDQRVSDEDLFPSETDTEYRDDFMIHAKAMFERLFQFLAIIMVNPMLGGLGDGPGAEDQADMALQVMRVFQRLMAFAWHWELLNEEQTSCLKVYIKPLRAEFDKHVQAYGAPKDYDTV